MRYAVNVALHREVGTAMLGARASAGVPRWPGVWAWDSAGKRHPEPGSLAAARDFAVFT